MKRLLALTLLTTAISVPAFAETSLNTGASTGIGVGIDAGAAKVGADVGADVDTSNSVNTSNESEDVGSTGTSSSGMSSSMSSDNSADTSAETSSSTSARTAAEAESNTSASASGQAITGENLARNDVIRIQQSLRQEGFYNGQADGVWGPRTASALMQYQQKNQLGATGQLNSNTLNQLGVELGASGSSETSTSGSVSGSAN
jgi:hypothetical protein